MTDSEKIAALIKDKHLTNAQFCAATGLQPAALSHITSGRSNPSLAILRSIARGFPDVNPMWLFGDEEAMYRDASSTVPSPSPASGAVDDAVPSSDSPTQGELFPAEETTGNAPTPAGAPITAGVTPVAPAVTPIAPPPASPAVLAEGAGQSMPTASPAAEAPSAGSAAAASTVIIQQVAAPEQPRRRNIVEIRVFYDDNTFEILTRKP